MQRVFHTGLLDQICSEACLLHEGRLSSSKSSNSDDSTQTWPRIDVFRRFEGHSFKMRRCYIETEALLCLVRGLSEADLSLEAASVLTASSF